MTPLRLLLRDARERSGVSQADLARRVAEASDYGERSAQAAISRYETTDREPSLPFAAVVLGVLGLDLSVIPRVSAARKKDRVPLARDNTGVIVMVSAGS